jgi:hypothetical protein
VGRFERRFSCNGIKGWDGGTFSHLEGATEGVPDNRILTEGNEANEDSTRETVGQFKLGSVECIMRRGLSASAGLEVEGASGVTRAELKVCWLNCLRLAV